MLNRLLLVDGRFGTISGAGINGLWTANHGFRNVLAFNMAHFPKLDAYKE